LKNFLRQAKKNRRKLRLQAYTRARKYEKEYNEADRELISKRRQARNQGQFFVEPEPKIAVVVRIRGIMGVSPKVKKILRLLRLRQLHNATFVKMTPPMAKMLKLVEPYIAYGYPNLKTVRSIIYKRGYASVRAQRLRIIDNDIIKKHLKQFNVICMEDIVHEIFTCGPNFKFVNKFLWPFKLNPPRGGFVKKRVHFTEGGDAGNREQYINKLVRRML
jgi:large subunit ribosomal protein L7e